MPNICTFVGIIMAKTSNHIMTLNLITFISSLSTRESLFTDHHELLNRLSQHYDVNYIFPEDLGKEIPSGPCMVLVGSGGVEQSVARAIDRLPSYVTLIADGLKNSLAASLEVLSWMRQEGHPGHVLHGDINYILRGVEQYVTGYEAVKRLNHQRIGVIGKPSGWLIASGVDYTHVRKHWDLWLQNLPLDEVVKSYNSIADEEVVQLADDFIEKARKMNEPTRNDVVKAMRLYRALKMMVDKYHLDGFTLNCFDLIPLTGTTGCVALAMLNAEGIPAGCEGDIQTILTMMAAKAVTGSPGFMANPSKILNNEAHEMIFAHCTIAPNMCDRYIIRNHYESLSGVGIEGIMAPGPFTVVKWGGRHMERCFVSRANLLECTSNSNMCRTQMRMQLQAPLDYFLNNSIGNHHVIIKGNYVQQMEALLRILGATPVVE